MAQRRWLRLDAGWMDSEWLIPLSVGARLAWVALLCHAKLAGAGGAVRAMAVPVAAKRWDIPIDDVEIMFSAAIDDGAITHDDDGDWVISHWREYQDTDYTSSKRQQKHRDKASRRDNRYGPLVNRDKADVTGVTPLQGCDPSRATVTVTVTDKETTSAPSNGHPKKPISPTVLTFPTVGNPQSWNLTTEQVTEWQELYPGIDVIAEARKALAWVDASPQKRKTAGGMKRFLVGWLGRATNSGRSGANQTDAEVLSSALGEHWK